MTEAEARRLLGVDAGAQPGELRVAYRRALRRTHPDLHGGDGAEARKVVAAYELLASRPAAAAAPPTPTPAPNPSPSASPAPEQVPVRPAVTVDGDTVAADLPAGDLFELLVEVGERIGDVTYLDGDAGLLEVLVQVAGHGPASVVLTLQGRAAGVTEAMCTVEPVGSWPAPPPEAVAEVLADGLRSVTPR